MIPVNELRIGNYVKTPNFDKYIIGFDDFAKHGLELEFDTAVQIHFEEIEPIPITEDWLLKFGFKSKDMGVGFEAIFYYKKVLKDEFYLRNCYLGGYYWGINLEKEKEFHDAQPISYVHQLQNLYFAITGKELEIK